jgi:type VI secretion system protein ImpH
MLSLFYRAFANNEPAVSADRPESDRFSAYVGSLIGRGMPSFLGRDALPDNVRLYYAGRFAAEPKNAEGLRAIVSDFFGLPVEIEEFVGEWIDVPQDSRWCLGRSAIGRSATVGARTWLCQGKFRIVIGPADQERAKKLFPGGEDFARLEAIVRSYIGDQLAWDVRILVHKESRHPWCLGRESRLGWTSSLGRGREHGNVIIR